MTSTVFCLFSSPCWVSPTPYWPVRCGPWLPLWYLSISWGQPTACMYLLQLKHAQLWLLLFVVVIFHLHWSSAFVHQHAIDPEPGTCSHCHGGRSHPGHQRIPGFRSVFLHLHLQSVFSICLCVGLWDCSISNSCYTLLSDIVSDFPHCFPPFFPTVALMAVVLLYFVDYLGGKRRRKLHFSHSSLLSLSILSQLFFPPQHSPLLPFLMWHLFTLLCHSSAHLSPYHQTHSLLNLSVSLSCSRRKFEPVSQSQTPTRSHFSRRVSSFDPSPSITAFPLTYPTIRHNEQPTHIIKWHRHILDWSTCKSSCTNSNLLQSI